MKTQIRGPREDSVELEVVLKVNGEAVQEFGTAQNGNKASCYVPVSEGDIVAARSTTTLAANAEEFTDLIVDGILRATSTIKVGRGAKGNHNVTFDRALFYRYHREKQRGLKLARMQIQTRNIKQDLAMIPGQLPSAVSTIELQHWRKYADQPSTSTATTTDAGPNPDSRAPNLEQYPRWSDLNLHMPTNEPSTFEVGFTDNNNNPTKSNKDRLLEERLGFKLFNTFTFRLASSSDLHGLGFTSIQIDQSLTAAPGLNQNQNLPSTLTTQGHQSPTLNDESKSQEGAHDVVNLLSSLDNTPKNDSLYNGNQGLSKLSHLPTATAKLPLLGNFPPHSFNIGDQAARVGGPSIQSSTPIRMKPLVLPGAEPAPGGVLGTPTWEPLTPPISSRKRQPLTQEFVFGGSPINAEDPKLFSLPSQPKPAAPGVRCGTPNTDQCHRTPVPESNQGVGLGLNQACFEFGGQRASNKLAYERCLAIIQQVSHKESPHLAAPGKDPQIFSSPFRQHCSSQSEIPKGPADFVPTSLVACPAVLSSLQGEKRKADYISGAKTKILEVGEPTKSTICPSLRTKEEMQRRTQEAHHRIAVARRERERLQEEERLILDAYLLEQQAKQLENENAERQVKIDAMYDYSSV
ncbi:uncharacterized protein BP5553_01170 [Venustampulla echinocandica]|uniref:Uncharacterized protein n=1 Tax=Venustampulla echinocandica TaxID=2656787 RepID=A0A370U087_9HELO|nr:uncharacterized protein BP5553_01170 [Venustampulla echinocandica]RDL41191.1 hypothetical protein BP5553_01170 [Venustampulla echinocandica]